MSLKLSDSLIVTVGAAVSVRGPDSGGLKPADGLPAVNLSTNGTAVDLVTEPGSPPSDPETSFPVTDYQWVAGSKNAEVADRVTDRYGCCCGNHNVHTHNIQIYVAPPFRVLVTVNEVEWEVVPDDGNRCENRQFHKLDNLDEDDQNLDAVH